MIQQTDHNKEWFQVTATFGNFGSIEEAENFRKNLEENVDKEAFISSETKGSWH